MQVAPSGAADAQGASRARPQVPTSVTGMLPSRASTPSVVSTLSLPLRRQVRAGSAKVDGTPMQSPRNTARTRRTPSVGNPKSMTRLTLSASTGSSTLSPLDSPEPAQLLRNARARTRTVPDSPAIPNETGQSAGSDATTVRSVLVAPEASSTSIRKVSMAASGESAESLSTWADTGKSVSKWTSNCGRSVAAGEQPVTLATKNVIRPPQRLDTAPTKRCGVRATSDFQGAQVHSEGRLDRDTTGGRGWRRRLAGGSWRRARWRRRFG